MPDMEFTIALEDDRRFVETGWSNIDPGHADGYYEKTGETRWSVTQKVGAFRSGPFQARGIAPTLELARQHAEAALEFLKVCAGAKA